MIKWLRYSGACVIITFNPLHWQWLPRAQEERNLEWPSPKERTWSVNWLFLTVRLWIDNGDW
jgi:hypothetical protein